MASCAYFQPNGCVNSDMESYICVCVRACACVRACVRAYNIIHVLIFAHWGSLWSSLSDCILKHLFCDVLSSLPSCSVLMEDFLKGHDDKELVFEQLPFNHPLFVMYSSGTTGPPKCMVHSQGVSVKDKKQQQHLLYRSHVSVCIFL